MLRSVTGSRYDHVGVLIKYPISGQVVIFESLSGKGVCKWDWLNMQQTNYWRDNFTRVVYRRLHGVQRDQTFTDEVNLFMQMTTGKEYRLSPSELFKS